MLEDEARRRIERAGYSSRLFVIGLALALIMHPSAWADTYSLVEGSLSLDETGRTDDLKGLMHLSVLGSLPGDPLQVVRVHSFYLDAGEDTFEPAGLPQYGDLPVIGPGPGGVFFPNFLLPSSRILLEDGDVEEMLLTAGGEPFDSDSDQVTFRFHDFVVDDSEHASRGFLPMNLPGRHDDDDHESEEEEESEEHEGEDDDEHDAHRHHDDEDEVDEAGLPGELEAEGRLFAWERTYAILTAEECRGQSPLPPFEPPEGGAVIIGLETSVPFLSRPFLDTGRPLGLVWMPLVLVSPDFIDGPIDIFDFVDPSATPSLAQLQMEAPQGADMSFDASGILIVSTDGDLYWSGALGDVPGLTHLEIYAANIYVTGEILLPLDTTLSLNAIDQLVIGSPPGDIGPPSPPPDGLEEGCLLALYQSAPREIGSFELKAVRDRGVEIEADRSETRRGRHGRRGKGRGARAAGFGSESLAVRDIRRDSLPVRADAEPSEGRFRFCAACNLIPLYNVRILEILPGGQVGEVRWPVGEAFDSSAPNAYPDLLIEELNQFVIMLPQTFGLKLEYSRIDPATDPPEPHPLDIVIPPVDPQSGTTVTVEFVQLLINEVSPGVFEAATLANDPSVSALPRYESRPDGFYLLSDDPSEPAEQLTTSPLLPAVSVSIAALDTDDPQDGLANLQLPQEPIPVPEPAAGAALLAGLTGLLALGRRRRRL